MGNSKPWDADTLHAAPVLVRYTDPSALRFFEPSVETVLKMAIMAAVVGVWVVTYAWGLEQRRLSQEWRTLACTYQLRDAERRLPFLSSLESGDACERLQRLGLTVQTP